MKEIIAKAPALDFAIEIASRRGEDANVDVREARVAEALHFGALERAQELWLKREIEIANLVDEQCPAVGLLEHARARADRHP